MELMGIKMQGSYFLNSVMCLNSESLIQVFIFLLIQVCGLPGIVIYEELCENFGRYNPNKVYLIVVMK